MTPPSAMASRNMHANAGPEPESAVHASKCFSSKNRQRPMDEKILRIIDRSTSVLGEIGSVETTVIPSRICGAFRGLYRTLKAQTDLARGVGHGADDLGRGKDPRVDLGHSHACEDADEELAVKRLLEARLA